MKKLISLLGTIGLTTTIASSVVACDNENCKFGIINGFNGEIHRMINEKNNIYVGTKIKIQNGDFLPGKLYSVDLKDNNKVTEIPGIEGAVYNLSIWNDKLYVGAATKKAALYSVDLKDNNKVTEIIGIEGAVHNLSIWNDKLYAGTKTGHDRGKLYSVDLKDNNKVTEVVGIEGEVDALIAFDNKLYVGTVTNYASDIGKFYSVDLKDNNKVTEIPISFSNKKGTIFSLVGGNDKYIYLGTIWDSYNGELYSVDLKDNNKVTEIPGIEGAVVRLIIENDKLYATTKINNIDGSSSKIYSVDLKDNNKVTEIDKISNSIVYGLAVINDYIYIGTLENNSNIYWFKM